MDEAKTNLNDFKCKICECDKNSPILRLVNSTVTTTQANIAQANIVSTSVKTIETTSQSSKINAEPAPTNQPENSISIWSIFFITIALAVIVLAILYFVRRRGSFRAFQSYPVRIMDDFHEIIPTEQTELA